MRKIYKISSFLLVGAAAWVTGSASNRDNTDNFLSGDYDDISLIQKAYADTEGGDDIGDDVGDGPNGCDASPDPGGNCTCG